MGHATLNPRLVVYRLPLPPRNQKELATVLFAYQAWSHVGHLMLT